MRRLYLFLSLFILLSCNQKKQSSDFVELKTINSNIVLDIRYATQNNFLKKLVYPSPRCFTLKIVAQKLDSIQTELEKQGLGLKIFDGYRPLSVQRMMWEILPDDKYVANPANGSRHNRGAAVDVTLVDSNGIELEMPTDFDDFTEKAAHAYTDLPEEVIKNRGILKAIMEKYGFVPIKSEWWHYDLKNYIDYPVVDYSFEEIDGLNNQ
jgi:D-alanyl-D-alanine dipeptidase